METGMYRIQTTDGTCEEIVRWRKCINNKIINVDIITVYNKASATCWLEDDKLKLIVGDTIEERVLGKDYDLDIEHKGDIATSWAEIDGIRLTKNVEIEGFTKVQINSIYRSIMKWDEEIRYRSSGSESESDSDCDNSKPKRNNWIYTGSTVNFHGNCKLNKILYR